MRRFLVSALVLTGLLIAACSDAAEEEGEVTGVTERANLTASSSSPAPADGAAVSSAAPADGAAAATAAPPTPQGPFAQRLWRSSGVQPASTPVLVGSVLVLYTHKNKALSLTALDPEGGTILWSRPAATSQTVPGVAITPEAVGDAVVHLAPATASTGSGYGSPALAILRNARSGQALITTRDPASHRAYPSACESDEDAVCVTVLFEDGAATVGLDESGQVYDVGEAGLAGWTGIGPLSLSRETGQRIGRAVDGEIVWEIDTAKVFGGDASTNTGWRFEDYADESLLVGAVGPADELPEEGATFDTTTRSTVVALDAATGETRWSREGMDFFCNPSMPAQAEDEDPPLVVCEWNSGTVTVRDETFAMDSGDFDIARLDPESGETLWTTPGGPMVEGEISPTTQRLDDAHLIAVTAESELVIDVTDGTSRTRDAADVVWLAQEDAIDIDEAGVDAAEPDAEQDSVRPAGLYLPTLLDGSRSEEIPWPIPSFVGAALDDPEAEAVDLRANRAVADHEGVSMYAAP